jgi:hypothetical protein
MGSQGPLRVCLAFALTTAFACSNDDGFDEVEADAECQDACQDWEDCVGEGFDVVDCRERCFEAADDALTDADMIDACSDCVEGLGDECADRCTDICSGAFVTAPVPAVGR